MNRLPRFLSILCALSFLNAIYGLVTGLSTAIMPPEVDSSFINDLVKRIEEVQLPIENLSDSVQAYYINLMLNLGNFGAFNFLFSGIQLVGVIMMYQLNRIGFLLYALAQLGFVASPVLFGGFTQFGYMVGGFTLAWNALWVVMYATQLKHFRS